jgi:TolB-like protein
MKYILSIVVLFFITGCNDIFLVKKNELKYPSFSHEEDYVSNSLNTTIIDIANQLFNSNVNKANPVHIILTSFVDLNELSQTSIFGRLISESMFNELHIRKWKVTDFRGQDFVNVNEDGEFHISRDSKKLKDNIKNIEYILVGTYVKFENQSLLINARIIDSISGDIISSARAVYRPSDCNLFGICENIKNKTQLPYQLYETNSITTDDQFTIVSDKKKDLQ